MATPRAAAPSPGLSDQAASVDAGLTLEQYASLCAELALDPSRSQETLARYRVSAESKLALDQQWKQRFAGDEKLRRQWEHAYRLYEAFLRSRPPRAPSGDRGPPIAPGSIPEPVASTSGAPIEPTGQDAPGVCMRAEDEHGS
jgi:hypothetical protein